MSLINQMLTDLEARRARVPRDQDRALDGLVAVAPRHLTRERQAPWPVLAAGIAVLAMAAIWSARSGLTVLTGVRSAPTAVAPKAALRAPDALAAPIPAPKLSAAPAPIEATAREPQAVSKPPAPAGEERVSEALAATAAVAPQATVTLPAATPVVAKAVTPVKLEEPTVPAKQTAPAPAIADEHLSEAPLVERRGDFHRAPAVGAQAKLPSAVDHAYALLDLGRIDEGLDALTAHLRETPKDVGARVRLAAELLKLERASDAETRLREGLAIAPGEARLARPLAHLVFDHGDPRAALAILQSAAPPVAADVEYHAFMAALQQQIGAHTAAAMSYRGVLEQRPDNGAWWIGLGISLDATGDHADAARAFNNALGDRNLSAPMRAYATREFVRLKDHSF